MLLVAESFAWMKAVAIALLLMVLAGCAWAPERSFSPLTGTGWFDPSQAELQRLREEADRRARAAGDNRPYPEGWPGGLLPRNRDPKIVESIHLGQTTAEVAKVMGARGWSLEWTRQRFLVSLHSSYRLQRSSRKEPADLKGFRGRLPAEGRYIEWRYQGFSNTADWIVVFLASPDGKPDAEPRVIARGVFGLGCMF